MSPIITPNSNGVFPAPTPQQVDAVLALLPILAAGPSASRSLGDVASVEQYLAHVTEQLTQALYENGFIINFDWPAWRQHAVRLLNTPEAMAQAGLSDLQRLATAVVRQARFSDAGLDTFILGGYALAFYSDCSSCA